MECPGKRMGVERKNRGGKRWELAVGELFTRGKRWETANPGIVDAWMPEKCNRFSCRLLSQKMRWNEHPAPCNEVSYERKEKNVHQETNGRR
jgi:hypothetical protein